jgi:hypothetical protein
MKTTKTAILSSTFIREFLDFIIASHSLTIGEYFPQICVDKSFFMLAATGLGKTVALPVYMLYLLVKKLEATSLVNPDQSIWECEPSISIMPTIWVVVPKITIAESEAVHLNELWSEFLLSIATKVDPKKLVLKSDKKEIWPQALFGYRTSNGSEDVDSPIQFITTGILPLIACGDNLDPATNSVIIDEAHVTLETTEDMEIGVALLKQQGVIVNYMSATVDNHELEERLKTTIIKADKSRFKNFYHNTGKPMLDCIEDIITKTLIEFDTSSEYYPDITGSTKEQEWKIAVLQGTKCFETTKDKPSRSSGLLIAINSQQGEGSDAKAVAQKIHKLCKDHGIEVLTFSSKINKDPKLKKLFDQAFVRIQKNNLKYIIISTSVIEMGITWPTLDYVVTMNSEYETVNQNGYEVLLTVPLGTNALKQRIGRVGRKRAGCGYITKEFGTEYTDLTDDELNGKGLKNQPISFPLSRLAPMKLSWLITQKAAQKSGWSTAKYDSKLKWVINKLQAMKLPSLYKEDELCNVAGMTVENINMYIKLGVADPANSEAVKLSERWVGTPGYAFVLKGWEWIVKNRGTYNYNRRYYEVFLVYNYIASLLNFPITSLLGIDPVTGKRKLATDFWQPGTIDNSDLMIMGQLVSGVARVTAGDGYAGYIVTAKASLSPTNVSKFANASLINFKEILKVYRKNDGDEIDPVFFAAFEDGYKDHDDDRENLKFSASESFYHTTTVDTYSAKLYPTVYPEILNIYKIMGVSSKLKKVDEGKYEYTVDYNGQSITGILDQKNHFCKLDEEHVFWGFLTPTITKDSKDITVQDIGTRFSWLLRDDTSFYHQ